MILEEYDFEKHLKLEKKESRIKGRTEFAILTQHLLADSRIDDLKRAAEDPEYLEQLLTEYQLNDQ